MIEGIVLCSITLLLVLARIYSRFFLTRAPGIDDAMIALTMVRAPYPPAVEPLRSKLTTRS